MLLRVRVVVPVLLTAALLIFAFSITDLPKVIDSIRSMPLSTWLVAFGFAALYLILKGAEFSLFLRSLGLSISGRQLMLAYAVGELCVTIPSGIYAQNYVLNKIDAASFSRSAAATTVMLIIEGAFILISLLVVPIPGWGWLRLLILSVFIAASLLLVTLRKVDWMAVFRVPLRPRHWIHVLNLNLLKMISELRHLRKPTILAAAAVLAAGYLFALIAAFFTVAHGVGIVRLSFAQAITIYFFSLAVMMTVGGFLTQVGIIEVVGLSAAQAWGYGLNEGLAMLLGFRIVWTASVWILSGSLMLGLRRELRRSARNDLEKPTH